MLKGKLMKRMKDKFGGEYNKTDGRWYWSNGNDKTLVTTAWLLKKLDEPTQQPEVAQESKVFDVVPPEIKIIDNTTTEAVKTVKKTVKKKKETDPV